MNINHSAQKGEVQSISPNFKPLSKIGGKNVKAFKTKRGKSTTEMEGTRL